jgi:hypothetical protein
MAQEKYALLISTGQTTMDDQFTHSEYWYDMFFLYRTLIDLGFTHDHIFVLYGNGADFNSVHPFYNSTTVYPADAPITDFAVSAANVDNIFNWLSTGSPAHGVPQLHDNDYLFYWWMGHGNATNCDDYSAGIATTGESVTDDNFNTYFGRLPACIIKNQYVMTCFSGGLVNELEGLHSMIHTSSECTTLSFSDMYDVPHAELSYHAACALRQQTPTGAVVASDTDGDGTIDIEETNTYAHTHTLASVSQIGDYRNISPLITPENLQPASLVINAGIYSRDYEEDDGTEPSNNGVYHIWYHGPDLWNRLIADGLTDNEDPEFGQTNHVYGRIHNLGCTTLDGITVDFSWCLSSAWSNMASWNPIGTVTVSGLTSNESRVITTPWSTVPSPGDYCLHTVLNVAGDLANASGESCMDNNKVQVNVTVVDNAWGWKAIYPFVIENGLSEDVVVDLFIDKLNMLSAESKVVVEIPGGLKFGNLEGGNMILSRTGTSVNISKEKTVVRQIPLKANEKKLAFLTITTPNMNMRKGMATVKISEVIKEKEMGGIIFNARSASENVVMAKLNKDLGNLFNMLSKKFKVNSGNTITTHLSKFDNTKLTNLTFTSSMKKIVEMERGTLTDMSKLMAAKEFEQYKMAIDQTVSGMEKQDLSLVRESQERLIFSTIPLFMREIKNSGF